MTPAAEVAAPGSQCGQEVGLASLRGVWPSGLANTRKRPQTPANARKHPQTPTSTHKQVAAGASTHKHPQKMVLGLCSASCGYAERPCALPARISRKKRGFAGPVAARGGSCGRVSNLACSGSVSARTGAVSRGSVHDSAPARSEQAKTAPGRRRNGFCRCLWVLTRSATCL